MLVQVSAAAARISDGVAVLTEQTPKGESKANGLAEGAVRDCKAKVRTLKCATEKFLGIVIGHDHRSLPFLCKYAGATMVRARRGADGKTAYERRFGKKRRSPMVRFGEYVLWLPSGTRDSRWNQDTAQAYTWALMI